MSESGVVKVFQAMTPAQLRKVARELAPYLVRGGFAAPGAQSGLNGNWVPANWGLQAGAIAETFPRQAAGNTANCLTSGQLWLTAIYMNAGAVANHITFASGAPGLTLGTSPHLWFAVYDKSLNLLRQTVDDTAAVWASYSQLTESFASPLVLPYTGIYYIGICISQGGGVLAAPGGAASWSNAQSHAPPVLSGSSTGGLLGVAPAVAVPMTADYRFLYAVVK